MVCMYDHHNNDHRAPPSYNGWPFRGSEVGRDEERGLTTKGSPFSNKCPPATKANEWHFIGG